MKKTLLIYFVIAAALSGSFAFAGQTDIDSKYGEKVKETWIGVTGTVTDPKPEQFILDYGKGHLTVDMDGWNWYAENFKKMNGDKVTVYGRLGDNLFEGKVIDATSVYDKKMGKYFFGRSRDEASEYRDTRDPVFEFWAGKDMPIEDGNVTVQGTVSGVNRRLFTVNTGNRKLTINTSSMPYDPLDKKGYQAIAKGDLLSVTGYISKAFMEKGELVADHIVVLKKE